VGRIVSPETVASARSRDAGVCLWGLEYPEERRQCFGARHVDHIETRGAGGDDLLENLATLCAHHHLDGKHMSGKITRDKLRAILTRLYGYKYGA
jgi:hypothetical protein